MRPAIAVLLSASVIGVGACSSSSDYVTGPSSFGGRAATAAKPGGGPGGGSAISVTGIWGTAPDAQATAIAGASFQGAILDNDSFHAEGNLGTVEIAGLQGTSGGDLVLVHMNSVRTLPSDGDFAHQFTVEWKDGNNTYRLLWSDPDYAHVKCDAVEGGACVGATIDSKDGTYSSNHEAPYNQRATGPDATLTVREGKRKAVPVGTFSVPFSLTVSRP